MRDAEGRRIGIGDQIKWDDGNDDCGTEAFVNSTVLTYQKSQFSSSTFWGRGSIEDARYPVNTLLVDSYAAPSSDDA